MRWRYRARRTPRTPIRAATPTCGCPCGRRCSASHPTSARCWCCGTTRTSPRPRWRRCWTARSAPYAAVPTAPSPGCAACCPNRYTWPWPERTLHDRGLRQPRPSGVGRPRAGGPYGRADRAAAASGAAPPYHCHGRRGGRPHRDRARRDPAGLRRRWAEPGPATGVRVGGWVGPVRDLAAHDLAHGRSQPERPAEAEPERDAGVAEQGRSPTERYVRAAQRLGGPTQRLSPPAQPERAPPLPPPAATRQVSRLAAPAVACAGAGPVHVRQPHLLARCAGAEPELAERAHAPGRPALGHTEPGAVRRRLRPRLIALSR